MAKLWFITHTCIVAKILTTFHAIHIHSIPGFFKNDKNSEVYILVEAFTTADTTAGKGKKVGEGKFAIYPRPNAPRMKLYAEPGEDYYHYTDVMSLLRTTSTDNIQMHCGRIRSTYSLNEVLPPKSPPTKSPTPPPKPTPRKTLPPTPGKTGVSRFCFCLLIL